MKVYCVLKKKKMYRKIALLEIILLNQVNEFGTTDVVLRN